MQVRTSAQSLWAELNHIVTYKQTVPDEVQRRVRRLIALCEIIDDEIEGAMAAVKQDAHLPERVAEHLDRWFYMLTGQSSDRETLIDIMDVLIAGVAVSDQGQYLESLDEFVDQHHPQLRQLLTDHPEARKIPLLLRPEAIFIFERLENAPMSFPKFWEARFRPDTIARLQSAWGPLGP